MSAFKKNKPAKKSFVKQAKNVIKEESEEVSAVVSGQLEKKIARQIAEKNARIAKQRGVVFLTHLPHGFFEEQMNKYFKQFGTVTRLRLCRSRRTGGSKGYAFVEFLYPEVAQVVTETMNNYLMFNKVVKASYIPPEKQNYNFFKTSVRKVKNKAGKFIYVSWKTAAIQRRVDEHNDWNDEAYQKRTNKNMEKLKKLNETFKNTNIDFTKLAILPESTNDETAKISDLEELENKITDSSKRKRKLSKDTVQQTNVKKQLKQTKNKKDIELEDLLGRTIEEDTEDEDYVENAEIDNEDDDDDDDDDDDNNNDVDNNDDDDENDDNDDDDDDGNADDDDDDGETTDEETYRFLIDTEETQEDEEQSDNKQKIVGKTPLLKNSKKNLKEKAMKLTKLDRMVSSMKLKKGIGAIKKPLKKTKNTKTTTQKEKQTAQNEKKKNMQVELAKNIAKPLSSIKVKKYNKLNKKK